MIAAPMNAILTVSGSLLVAALTPAQQAIATVFGPMVNGGTGSRIAPAGDLDGDQVPDFLVSSPRAGNGLIHLVSGATLTTRTITNPGNAPFGDSVLVGTGDLNLDGVPDLVVNSENNLLAYSGANGALLWQTSGVTFRAAAKLGDLDLDGRAEVGATVSLGNSEFLWILRGSTGAVLQTLPTPLGGNTADLIAIGDIDNDGITEVARTNGTSVAIYRVSPPTFLRSWNTVSVMLAAGNVDGDARNEVLTADGSNAYAFSASTGALVRNFGEVHNGTFTVLGDIDGDGFADLVLRMVPGTPGDAVDFVSGATGARLGRWPGTARLRPVTLAGVGDVNHDGFGDLLMGHDQASANGSSSSPTGGWQLVSGKLLATMTYIPVQCAGGPWFPQLGITRPILGSSVRVEGRDGPTFSGGGVLALSTQPTQPFNFGVVGCDAWFDVTNWAMLYQPGGSSWVLQVPLPNAPQLAGLGIALQAFYVQTNSPIGMDLSNGVWAKIGY